MYTFFQEQKKDKPKKKLRMKKQLLIALVISLLQFNCTVPQYFWPQKDITFQEINQPTLDKKILIASRESEFKNKIVQTIKEDLKSQAVYIKVIGIESLKDEDANHYSAVVILNTAMGWKADRKVESFLANFGDLKTIIVLTTSDGGDVLVDTEGRQIDAISSASVKSEINNISNNILRKIKILIEL